MGDGCVCETAERTNNSSVGEYHLALTHFNLSICVRFQYAFYSCARIAGGDEIV